MSLDSPAITVVLQAPPVAAVRDWPNGFDALMLGVFLAVAVGAPALGYLFMARDFRRWLRSLRRALVVVVRAIPATPYWVMLDRPPCLVALDLELPCTESDVLAAYRNQVKQLHPDRGGDMQQFLRLQKHFEQAVHLVQQSERNRRGSRRDAATSNEHGTSDGPQ